MGSTVFTDCAVGAFARPDGSVAYLLFEETYESNCFPQVPHWSARSVGSYEEMLAQVFRLAAACEGGALCSRRGAMRPEACLKRWDQAFQAPFEMPDVDVRVEVTSSYRSPVLREEVPAVQATLRAIGREDLARRIAEEVIALRLHRDVDVLAALYGPGSGLGLWRVVGASPVGRPSRLDLAPPRRRQRLSLPSVAAYALDAENVVVKVGDAPLLHHGWRYATVAHYAAAHAPALELQASGAGRNAITAFRAACEAAPPLPGDTEVLVPLRRADGVPCDGAADLAAALGIESPATEDGELAFRFAQADDAARAILTRLPRGHVQWRLPAAPLLAPVPPGPVPVEQLSMF